MQNGSLFGIYTHCIHIFVRLAPICMLSRCLLTKISASELSRKFIKRMHCWLGRRKINPLWPTPMRKSLTVLTGDYMHLNNADFAIWGRRSSRPSKTCLPDQQHNKLPPELRCRNFANKYWLGIQIGARCAKTCMQCVHIPPLLVGYLCCPSPPSSVPRCSPPSSLLPSCNIAKTTGRRAEREGRRRRRSNPTTSTFFFFLIFPPPSPSSVQIFLMISALGFARLKGTEGGREETWNCKKNGEQKRAE